MNSIRFAFGAGAVVALWGCSKATKPNAIETQKVPRLHISNPKHDFGDVVEGEKVTHDFIVSNLGSAVLHIDRVHTSCDCTKADFSSREIAPGSAVNVKVTFDTNHRSGEQNRTIGFASDDSTAPLGRLEIHARVLALLAAEPQTIQLRAEPGKIQATDLWLVGTLKEQARLKVVEKPEDPVTVKVIEQAVDAGASVQGLRFTIVSKTASLGSGLLSVQTGLANPPTLEIGYRWLVAGNVDVSPPELYFATTMQDSLARTLRVTSRRADFKLQRVRVVAGPFDAKIEDSDAGAAYEVRVWLKPVEPGATAWRIGKLELISNDPLEPKKEVTLRIAMDSSPPSAR